MSHEAVGAWGCGGLIVIALFLGALGWLWENAPIVLVMLPVAGVLALLAGVGYASSQRRTRERREAAIPSVPWRRGDPCPLCGARQSPTVRAAEFRLRVHCECCDGDWWAPLAYLRDELEQ